MPGDISSAAPFLVAAALLPGSTLTVHDVGLNPLRAGLPRRARADGRARRRSSTGARSRASRSATSRCGARRARRDEDRRRRGAAARRRAAADRAARRDGARHDRRHRRRGAAGEGVRPDRGRRRRRCGRSASARRGASRRLRRSAASRRGPRGGTIDAAGDHRIAMLGAVAGVVSREGVQHRRRGLRRDQLPRLLRLSLVETGEIVHRLASRTG